MSIAKEKLDLAQTSLLQFDVELVLPEGNITLPVIVGNTPKQLTIMIKFLAVKCPSVYNHKGNNIYLHLAMKFCTN